MKNDCLEKGNRTGGSASLIYKCEFVCLSVCVSVCPDVRYARPHLGTDFFETWQGGTWAFWAPAKLYGDDVTSGSVTSHGRERDDPPL